MKIQPILPAGLLIALFAVMLLITGYAVLRNKHNLIEKLFSMLRLGIIYLLALIIGLRPVTVKSEYEFATKNLDVLFVVDTTISMWARDYNGSKERMDGVINDIKGTARILAGSNFALIAFDDRPKVLSPFTQDMDYIIDLAETFTAPDKSYAEGSDMSVPYKDIESLLLSSTKKENRKTIVFLFSDGEITNGKELTSYADLAQYIDSGAVLGYGTESGGKMKDGYGYLYDYSSRADAVSKIDEGNLKQIAEDLGVEYMNLNNGSTSLSGLAQLIREGSATVVEKGDGAEVYEDTYFYYAIALGVMLLIELIYIIRRERL